MKRHCIPELEGNQIREERFLYSVDAWFSDVLDLTNRIIFHLSCVAIFIKFLKHNRW